MKSLTIAVSLIVAATGLILALMPLIYPGQLYLIEIGGSMAVVAAALLIWATLVLRETCYYELRLVRESGGDIEGCLDVMSHDGRTFVSIGDIYHLIDQFNDSANGSTHLKVERRQISADKASSLCELSFEEVWGIEPLEAELLLFATTQSQGATLRYEEMPEFKLALVHYRSEILAMETTEFDGLLAVVKGLADNHKFIRLQTSLRTTAASYEVFDGIRS
ncbi:MAG: hypothetical protein HZB70_01165 [Candidatus Berkelbacteria bacterium]|nr:MAG: hypothetical protein HZB70_01165 [Candidatus Berkelbacteria bacterium]QQG52051.1 MAG: hypothetical protein HY845_01830 [Candidatus Berkelbacteria bacterium]